MNKDDKVSNFNLLNIAINKSNQMLKAKALKYISKTMNFYPVVIQVKETKIYIWNNRMNRIHILKLQIQMIRIHFSLIVCCHPRGSRPLGLIKRAKIICMLMISCAWEVHRPYKKGILDREVRLLRLICD